MFKELTLYNNDFTIDYYEDVDINEWDSDSFYEPNKYLIIKTLINEVEYIQKNTDRKYNCFKNNVIKYTVMRLVEGNEFIELYNENYFLDWR